MRKDNYKNHGNRSSYGNSNKSYSKPGRGEHHPSPSIFKNMAKIDNKSQSRPTSRPSNNRKPYNKFNKGKPKFAGFANRIKFKHVDPSGYTEQALKDYIYCNEGRESSEVSHEFIRKFRSRLFDNYHLYEIRISNENHFNSGYTFIHIGWMAAAKEPSTEAINLSIWFTANAFDTVPNKVKDIIYFKTITLSTQLFSTFGKYCRICLDQETYAIEKPYLRSCSKDTNPNFNSVVGEKITSDEDHVILISKNVGIPIKIGHGLDTQFIDEIRNTYDLEIKIIPFVGVALYHPSTNPKVKYDSQNLIATINKCDDSGIIRYACECGDKSIVEEIIDKGINTELSKHHKVYSKPTKIVHAYSQPYFPKLDK